MPTPKSSTKVETPVDQATAPGTEIPVTPAKTRTRKPKPKAETTPAVTPAKAETPAGKTRAMSEVPAAQRRLALVKTLRRLKAFSAGEARPVKELSEKLGYNQYDVYCLGYHKFPLATQGFVKSAPVEGAGVGYYLTAKGQKTDPE